MSTTPTRSTFVTVVAWVLIVFSGLGVLVSVMQNVLIWVMEPVPLLNARLIFSGVFVMLALTLAAAIGLLRRRNWGRLGVMAILCLGMAWQVVGVVWQFSAFSDITGSFDASAAAQQELAAIRVIQVSTLLFVAVLLGLFGWVVKRLSSDEVKAECAPTWGE